MGVVPPEPSLDRIRYPGPPIGGGHDVPRSSIPHRLDSACDLPVKPIDLGSPSIHPTAFVAPGTHLYGDITVGEQAVIMFGTVMRAELDRIVVGARSNIQDNSVVHVDDGVPCTIGSDVTIGHAAVIHGATIGDHCLIGIGATVLNNAIVGEGAWVAAGSLVGEGKTLPPWTLAIGTPAKAIRRLTAEEMASQRDGVENYLRFAASYRQLLDRQGSPSEPDPAGS